MDYNHQNRIGRDGQLMTVNNQKSQRRRHHFKIIDKIANSLGISDKIRDQGHNYHEDAAERKIQNKQKKYVKLTEEAVADVDNHSLTTGRST